MTVHIEATPRENIERKKVKEARCNPKIHAARFIPGHIVSRASQVE